MVDLRKFVEWSKNNPGCKVQVEVGGYGEGDAGKIKIWVYNFQMGIGQFVSSVDEIDLNAEYHSDMERKRQKVEKYFRKAGAV